MKKIFKRITVLSLVTLLIVGCSKDVYTNVSDKDEVILEVKGSKLTKGNIYNYLKLRFGPNMITSNLVEYQLDKYVTLDDNDMKKAKERLEDIKEQFKDSFEEIITQSGYEDEEDYFNKVILNTIKSEKLYKDYLNNNLETLVDKYYTKKIKKIRTNSKADAEKALEELKELETITSENFESIAKTYSQEDNKGVSSIEHVYAQRKVLPFLNEKLATTNTGLIDEIIMDGEVFYIVYIEELNLETDSQLIIDSIVENEDLNKETSEAMFKQYSLDGNFTIYDSDLYDLYKASNPSLFN